MSRLSLFSFLLVFCATVFAAPVSVRWTGKQDTNADLNHILDVVKDKTGLALSITDFVLIEDRELANNHFTMLAQRAGGLPLRSMSIRRWTSRTTGALVQLEALLDAPPPDFVIDSMADAATLSSEATMKIARNEIKRQGEDPLMLSATFTDMWMKNVQVREVKAKGKRGNHIIVIRIIDGKVLEHRYTEYPQAGHVGTNGPGEYSIAAKIYPIYEETESVQQTFDRVPGELRYVKTQMPRPTMNPFTPMLKSRYLDTKYNPVLGLTAEGRKQGFWSMAYLKGIASGLIAGLPMTANTFEAGNGVILDGRYATISLHPNVKDKFTINFTPGMSAQLKPDFRPTAEDPNVYEMIPMGSLLGRPLKSADEAMTRPARRLADHDPASYINDGFDELQVYWSINQMFDSLRAMGFTDPELSTRPFNAFLYDPDITMRDNAYYTDDTINFTTYSPKAPNFARDNTTIWHELGHGVMDRLMGDHITLADTGGLSEGMADFVAQMVLNDVTDGQSFPGKADMRIFNQTGFHLTNEVHDDGESYGGAMNDLLTAAMATEGKVGLAKVTDLTLEAMRLSRNNPGLTASDWFERMLFADELGSNLRKAGEMRQYILNALGGRNFVFGNAEVAKFTIKNGTEEVTSTGPGSRENPIKISLGADETSTYKMNFSLKSSEGYKFKYPVTIKVGMRGGPLQGALHWKDEDKEPMVYELKSESDSISTELTATGKCDEVNQPDGSCKDFAYISVWNAGETKKPQAKKRFYLRMLPKKQ